MVAINNKVLELAKEVEQFSFDDCDANSMLDIQELYTFDFVAIVKRFINNAKRIENDELKSEIEKLNVNIRHIYDAQILRIDVISVIDFINELLSQPTTKYYLVESTVVNSNFSKIKPLIIHSINKAKYTIWVAVAWFTDKDLARLLLQKSREGVNVQVIMSKCDDINNHIGHFLDHKIELYGIDNKNNLMHNKFCIIDLHIVLHGSFNWTYRANKNNETLEVINSRIQAEHFADEFKRLKQLAIGSSL